MLTIGLGAAALLWLVLVLVPGREPGPVYGNVCPGGARHCPPTPLAIQRVNAARDPSLFDRDREQVAVLAAAGLACLTLVAVVRSSRRTLRHQRA